MQVNNVELWLGKKRVGEELKGNIDGTEVFLEPISKINRDHVLSRDEDYTLSVDNINGVWTCRYLNTEGNAINLRITAVIKKPG
jgi:hypothetical protein